MDRATLVQKIVESLKEEQAVTVKRDILVWLLWDEDRPKTTKKQFCLAVGQELAAKVNRDQAFAPSTVKQWIACGEVYRSLEEKGLVPLPKNESQLRVLYDTIKPSEWSHVWQKVIEQFDTTQTSLSKALRSVLVNVGTKRKKKSRRPQLQVPMRKRRKKTVGDDHVQAAAEEDDYSEAEDSSDDEKYDYTSDEVPEDSSGDEIAGKDEQDSSNQRNLEPSEHLMKGIKKLLGDEMNVTNDDGMWCASNANMTILYVPISHPRCAGLLYNESFVCGMLPKDGPPCYLLLHGNKQIMEFDFAGTFKGMIHVLLERPE